MTKAFARAYLDELKSMMERIPLDSLNRLIATISRALAKGRQVFVMGNGGSAATASHFACNASHLNFSLKKKLRVTCLTDDGPTILAIANDRSYEEIFVEQLRALLDPGDVVLGISASGNSPNVLRAIEFANRKHAATVALTGFDGGRLARIARVAVVVPGRDIKKIEDIHLMLVHIIVHALRR
jgi:D-sedoheptulose 7-phosphate isomerase